MRSEFPKKSVVWSGSILEGIANATMTAQNRHCAQYGQWKGTDFLVDGSNGRYGAITFGGKPWVWDGHLFGAFFSARSDRSPWRRSEEEYDVERFLRGIPDLQRSLAEQGALQHLRSEEGGKVIYHVTAVFWNDGEYLTAPEPWDVLLQNGVDLISDVLMEDPRAALDEMCSNWRMSPEQVAFVWELFERKIADPSATIELTSAQVEWLRSTAEKPGDEKALRACREAFAAMEIIVP
jgi:hypothetical protein